MGLRFLDKGGTLVNMAVHDSEVALNQLELGAERRLVTSCNFRTGEYRETLGWLAEGRLAVAPWLTAIGREEVPAAFERLLDPEARRGLFKVVVVDDGAA
jgi:threonine dehydrogenase-like Zn-dependent dehydrogenase